MKELQLQGWSGKSRFDSFEPSQTSGLLVTARMKTENFRPGEIDTALDLFLTVGERAGYHFQRGHTVLDFGCGIGNTVEALLARGAEAYGVDVRPFWDSDFPSYWREATRPPQFVIERLRMVHLDNYVLPFEDCLFDFCISSQVFEHVLNYEQLFRELRRVLKPGAISLHLFPGPLMPVEPHIFVPLIPLCRYDWWLALWAITRRSPTQQDMTWRDVVRSNRAFLNTCSYPSRRTLQRIAKSANLEIAFLQRDYLECSSARSGRLLQKATRVGAGFIAAPVLEAMCQRMMALRRSI